MRLITILIALAISLAELGLVLHHVGHQSGRGQVNAGPYFEGDMYAQMPPNTAARSTSAEDEQRARSAANWVRVVFDKESQPQFVDILKSALQKQWNPNLGYQLVFGESRGPLEEAATAVTLQMKVQTYTKPYQINQEPQIQPFFVAVDLLVYPLWNNTTQTRIPTSWDNLTLSCENPLPTHFLFHSNELENINRKQLGTLREKFVAKLNEVPAFCFFPDQEFDAIRDLYIWPLQNGTNGSPVDPLVFAEAARRIVGHYANRPGNRSCMDSICTHLVAHGATNYVDGISIVLCEWLPHLSEGRRQLLETNLAFANYALIKTLLSHRQGYLLFRTIPQVWTDPNLANFSRQYWREKQNSPELGWMAREFADKLKPAPLSSQSATVVGNSKRESTTIIGTYTNHLATAQPPSHQPVTTQ